MGILRYSSACVWCPVAHPTSAKVGLGICSEFWGSERGGVCTCQLQIVYVYLGGGRLPVPTLPSKLFGYASGWVCCVGRLVFRNPYVPTVIELAYIVDCNFNR